MKERVRKPLVFVLPSLGGGGAERVATSLLPLLRQHYELTLALLENRCKYPVPEGVPVKAFSKQIRGPTGHLARIPYHILAIVRMVREARCPCVLSFMEQANISNLLAAKITKHRTVISQRTDPLAQYAKKRLIGGWIMSASRALYPHADHVIAVSEGVKRTLLAAYRVQETRVSVVHNPVDADELRSQAEKEPDPPAPARFILHIGRLDLATKRQDLLISAFHRLRRSHEGLSLVLLGEGPDHGRVQHLIEKHNLTEAVFLRGWQANVGAYLARAEALVLCSRYEGWPNALAEAMACGCPVVASDCSWGPREILNSGEYGLLVPADDVSSLASGFDRLLTNQDLRQEFVRRGRERAEMFALPRIGLEYVRVLDDTMGVQQS